MLREGFTTGTAAAAASRAAVRLLLAAPDAPSGPPAEDTPLPGGGRLTVPVARAGLESGPQASPLARAVVVKDAGDDPDVTHGAEIHAVASLAAGPPGSLEITGGAGVGRVTLPGLPVPPGRPAINPGPLAQIRAAVAEVLAECGLASPCAGEAARPGQKPPPALRLTIEVPAGEALARRTMNPRLGILGGISILGTSGIVRPLSHEAWMAAVRQGLSVARAAGISRAVLTTGRRSERFFQTAFPDTPALALVQAADFFAQSMEAAAELGFSGLAWSLFFGKLVKQAQGFPSTHAANARIDFPALAQDCRAAGLPSDVAERAARANTAMEVQTLAAGHPAAPALYRRLAAKALARAREFARQAGPGVLPDGLGLALFDFSGNLLLFQDETSAE